MSEFLLAKAVNPLLLPGWAVVTALAENGFLQDSAARIFGADDTADVVTASGDTGDFDGLFVEAKQQMLSGAAFGQTRLHALLAVLADSADAVALWYGGDVGDLDRAYDKADFLDRVRRGLDAPSVEVYVQYSRQPEPRPEGSASASLLIAQWSSSWAPVVNGVVQRDGRVHRIRAHDAPRGLPLQLAAAGACDLGAIPELIWTYVSPFAYVTDLQTGLVAIVGDGAMGADGFVAVQSGADPETLLWVACFDFSNPFESARFDAGLLKVRNNLDEEWHFDLDEPWNVAVFGAS